MSIQTFADHTGDNSTTSFAFSFPYLDDSHVVVQVDQASVSGGAFDTKALTDDYTIQTSPTSAIIFNSAPATGDRIRIKRDSASNTALVDFENGSVLTEVELDRAYLHNLYLNEEIEEGSGKNVMTKNISGNFEADLAKIVDLADPTLAQDAATKNYVDTRGLQDFDGANTTSDVNLNSNKLTNVTDPGSNQDAATKNYVDTQDALQVTKAGDSMSGDLAMGGNDITGVNSVRDLIAPAAGSHATNKTYVDAGDADQVNKTGDSMTGPLAMGDNKITGLATPTATADATNKSYVDAEIATTLATGVAGGPIGTANIADDAVTADKIANTAVTPGAYTATNLTVDAQGRITAAANGSASPTAAEVKTLYESNADTNEFDDAEQTKLAGIAAGATVNSSDATLLERTNHAGTQAAATISDFDAEVANNSAVTANTAKVTNATHTGDVTGSTSLTIADNAVTAAKISATDTTFNVGTNVGIGAVASGTFKLDVTGTGNNANFQANNAGGASSIFVRNNSSTGISAIVQLISQTGGTSYSKSLNIDLSATNNYLSMVHGDGDQIGVRLQNSNGGSGSETGSWYPTFDNKTDLGLASNRWGTVFAGTGAINTSDRNEKEEIEELSEAELRVAQACKGLVRKFKFKGGVRKHIGVIAQDVRDAFSAEGLDAHEYGLFCSDTWTDEDGNTVTRLGIRYEELLAFIISAL